ncbi:MAG: hypothetical protein IKC11_04720 [Clostridia bacterium]|nr:hypothetical protein [Clostridia bacterium]
MKYYYDGMQEYVDGISEAIADGITLAEEAKMVYTQVGLAIKSHLKAQGYCKEYAESFVDDKLGVTALDFEDVKNDFEDFWQGVEADVIDNEVKVVLTRPEVKGDSVQKQEDETVTILSIKQKADKFLEKHIKKSAEFYSKLANLADFAEEKGIPQVGGSYLDIADIVTENLTLSVVTMAEGVDSVLQSLGFLNESFEEKDND